MLRYAAAFLLVLTACSEPQRIAIGHSFDENGRPCTTYQTERDDVYVTECGTERTRPEPIPSLALPDQSVAHPTALEAPP
jgi:hypothetical protein